MSLTYAQEKAYKLLGILATSQESLIDRIESAYEPSYRSLADEAERGTSGLHSGLNADIVRLNERMTAEPAVQGKGSVRATLDTLSGLELVSIADELVHIAIATLQVEGDGSWRLRRSDE